MYSISFRIDHQWVFLQDLLGARGKNRPDAIMTAVDGEAFMKLRGAGGWVLCEQHRWLTWPPRGKQAAPAAEGVNPVLRGVVGQFLARLAVSLCF